MSFVWGKHSRKHKLKITNRCGVIGHLFNENRYTVFLYH